MHALLDPITRRDPFELIVGDYLSLPKGVGGYHTVGLYLDTYSQHVWGFKHKVTSSAKTTQDGLEKVFQDFMPAALISITKWCVNSVLSGAQRLTWCLHTRLG